MVGQNVGKYKVLDRIGRGGMGTVYRAMDETLHRDVAIKVLNAELGEPEVAKRFRAEAITVARLNHPGIATIYELLQHDGQWLMVMEFVRGETLERLIERMGALSAQRASELCMQSLAALAHAHSLGVVHRDLKPANLMITESGVVKIMDFGIARVVGAEHLTSAGYMMGTPAYMAPEQVLGLEIDARADLYSMGVVFYRLMTGKLPFKGETPFALAQSQVHDPPTPAGMMRADLPPWVEQLLARALAKAPPERFQSAIEMHEAFARCLAGLPLTSMYSPSAPTEALMTPPRPMPSGAFAPRPPTGAQTFPGQWTGSMPPTVASGAQPVPAATGTGAVSAKQFNVTTAVLAAVVVVLAVVVGVILLRPAKSGDSAVRSSDAAAPPPTSAPQPVDTAAGQPQSAPSAGQAAPNTTNPPATPPATGTAPPTAPVVPPPAGQAPGSTAANASNAAGAKQGARGTSTTPPTTPTGPPPVSPPPVAGGAATGSAPPPTVTGTTPVSTPQPAAPPPPPPSASTEDHVTFSNLKILVITGKRALDQDVILTFAGGQVSVSPRTGGSPIAALPYKSILRATYARNKDPKWDSAFPAPPDGMDMPGGLFGRPTRHWLAIQTKQSFVVLRLEDVNFAGVLAAIESRVGVKVERK